MCSSLSQHSAGAVGAAPAKQSPAIPWDKLSPDSHSQASSRPAWTPESATRSTSQKQRNGFHQSSHQGLQENLTPLGLSALGEGDKAVSLEHRAQLGDSGIKAMQKNEFLPGFVDEMW